MTRNLWILIRSQKNKSKKESLLIGTNYKILPTKEFSKDFKKLGKQFQERIRNKVEEVAENPTRYKQFRYDLSKSCRLWVGKHRIIF